MKPVAVFRYSGTEGPGYFARYLAARGIPWTLVKIDSGDPLPLLPSNYAGLVLMGGPMSVNDDLPWIPHALALIARAIDEEVPVLGHCLGGQLMARALGGSVGPNPVKEIGWGRVRVEDSEVARTVVRTGEGVPVLSLARRDLQHPARHRAYRRQ